MTDMSKYKNVSLSKETYAILEKLSKVLLPDAKLSVAKTIETIANEKAKKVKWQSQKKLKRVSHIVLPVKVMGMLRLQNIYDIELQVHQCWDCELLGL